MHFLAILSGKKPSDASGIIFIFIIKINLKKYVILKKLSISNKNKITISIIRTR